MLIPLGTNFWTFRNTFQNLLRKKQFETCKIQGFWPPEIFPKPFQNQVKIDVPNNVWFFLNFRQFFLTCCKSQTSKFMRPRSVLLAFRTNRLFAFRMHLGSEKHTKNLTKTIPKRPKNRVRKQSFFQYGFFMVSASILEGLSVQMDGKTATKGRPFLSKRLLDLTCGHLWLFDVTKTSKMFIWARLGERFGWL